MIVLVSMSVVVVVVDVSVEFEEVGLKRNAPPVPVILLLVFFLVGHGLAVRRKAKPT